MLVLVPEAVVCQYQTTFVAGDPETERLEPAEQVGAAGSCVGVGGVAGKEATKLMVVVTHPVAVPQEELVFQ